MSGLRVIPLTEPEYRALCTALDDLDPETLQKVAVHAVTRVRSAIYYPKPPQFMKVARADMERESRKHYRDGK